LVFLDVDLAGPRRDPPIDRPHRIARQVRPRLHELDARTEKWRMVRPVAEAVGQLLHGEHELLPAQCVAGVEISVHRILRSKDGRARGASQGRVGTAPARRARPWLAPRARPARFYRVLAAMAPI